MELSILKRILHITSMPPLGPTYIIPIIPLCMNISICVFAHVHTSIASNSQGADPS